MIAGLTGLSCAGKNHIAVLLAARGCRVLDVDVAGWAALDDARAEIAVRWGREVLREDGGVDRKALARRVFADAAEREVLEGIVHPRVDRAVERWLSEDGWEGRGGVRIINAALLHKMAVFPALDAIIMVRAAAAVRLLRAKKRDKRPVGEILRRFASQKSFYTQYFQNKTDIYTVCNGIITEKSRALARIFRRDLDTQLDKIPWLPKQGGGGAE
jgi:dephospho-CoA kinase